MFKKLFGGLFGRKETPVATVAEPTPEDGYAKAEREAIKADQKIIDRFAQATHWEEKPTITRTLTNEAKKELLHQAWLVIAQSPNIKVLGESYLLGQESAGNIMMRAPSPADDESLQAFFNLKRALNIQKEVAPQAPKPTYTPAAAEQPEARANRLYGYLRKNASSFILHVEKRAPGKYTDEIQTLTKLLPKNGKEYMSLDKTTKQAICALVERIHDEIMPNKLADDMEQATPDQNVGRVAPLTSISTQIISELS